VRGDAEEDSGAYDAARERSVRLTETLSTRERVEMRAVANRRGVCAR